MNRILDYTKADRLTAASVADATGALEMFAKEYVPYMNIYLPVSDINTLYRLCAFLTMTCHESGFFQHPEERFWGTAYERRKDLGNTEDGDGIWYKGRGLIRIRGKKEYRDFFRFSGVDVLKYPGLLACPEMAVWSSVWYWKKRKLNVHADRQDIGKIVRLVTGKDKDVEKCGRLYEKCLAHFR